MILVREEALEPQRRWVKAALWLVAEPGQVWLPLRLVCSHWGTQPQEAGREPGLVCYSNSEPRKHRGGSFHVGLHVGAGISPGP